MKAVEAIENLRGKRTTVKRLEKDRERGREKLRDSLLKLIAQFREDF
jgi:hypothetical protein